MRKGVCSSSDTMSSRVGGEVNSKSGGKLLICFAISTSSYIVVHYLLIKLFVKGWKRREDSREFECEVKSRERIK